MEQEIINHIVLESLNDLRSIKRQEISFPKLLSKSNPFELVVNCKTANDLVLFILEAHKRISSQTIWGNYLESIAVKISNITLNGYKSKEECSDLEWVKDNKKHYRGWKSSPNWCNSDQKKAVNTKMRSLIMNDDFGSFKVLTSYGKTTKKVSKVGFVQLSGQDAWEEISSDSDLYNKLMNAIHINNEIIGQFLENIYISDMSKSVSWFTENFTNEDTTINFNKINNYVSGRNNVEITKW